MTTEQEAALARRTAERMLRAVVRELSEQAAALNPTGRADDDRGGRAATLDRAIGVLASTGDALIAEACEHEPDLTEHGVAAVHAERQRQIARWGVQRYPDGTGPQHQERADHARAATECNRAAGTLTWNDILSKEVADASVAHGADLAGGLVQVAGVAVAWREDLVRRGVIGD